MNEPEIVLLSSIEIYNMFDLGDLGETEYDTNPVLLLERKLWEAEDSGLARLIAMDDFEVKEPLKVENGVLTDGHHRLAVMWENRPYDVIPVKVFSD